MREAIERWNSHVIAALLRDLGVEVHYLGIVPDDKEAIYRAVSDAVRRFDMVITTGGVSVGEPDHVGPCGARRGTRGEGDPCWPLGSSEGI